MHTTSRITKKAKQALILTDDSLTERFGPSPLFPEKIEKATRIMSIVRKKQAEQTPNN